MSQRTDRVGDLVRRELAELLLHRLQDPRVRLATVSAVRVTPDLRRAVVRVSALGSLEERQAAIEGLGHARGFLRKELARRLRGMKVVPDLTFELDRGAETSQRIEELLEDHHDENQPS